MAYNRWLSQDYLAHHGVKGQKWGEKNGPPYPLDSSKSDGHKLLKGDGSPQGKKKYKTSEKTAHKRAERKARTVKEDSPEKKAKLQSAKNEDKWELDFLELVQDEDWAPHYGAREHFDKKRMLKEYSEYLDDRDAYSQKGLPEDQRMSGDEIRALRAEYQNKLSSKPQKKSISNRINSFMDRVFGNSVKAQEKGQQKIDVNYEPVTSEKAKTKRGETYEINDWNGDAQDTIKAFKSNPEPHINIARKAAIQEARRIIGWYAKDNPEAQRILNMSDQQLSKRIGLDFASAFSQGTIEFSFGDAGTGDFLGHEVDVEYDLNRRKVMNVSVNG